MFVVLIREQKEVPNNVFAYNYQGEVVWGINDIIQAKIPRGFDNIEKLSDKILEVESELGIIFEIDVINKIIKNKVFLR